MLRDGWKTTEFWLAVGGGILTYVFPEAPKEAFLGIITYIGSRGFAKIGGDAKAGIMSTEFWVTLASTGVPILFPGVPLEALYAIWTYVGARGALKFFSNGGIKALTGATT